jgi:antirestriction protein ArdC
MDIHERITERILAQLEKGVIPWRKTWHGSQPINYVSRKSYRGVNLLLLPFGGEWLTFKQAKDAGGRVKKGEKASMIVFYKMMEREDENGKKTTFPFLQYSNVFHVRQCEGIASKLEPDNTSENVAPIEKADSMIAAYVNRSGVIMSHVDGSDRACYQPSTDTITLPVIGQFESAEEYYSAAFHECGHSTGHRTRLDRITETAAFGSQTYCREELVAEMFACFIMNLAGVEIPATFANSTAYIAGWSKKLKEDVKAILSASSQAQKASDFFLGIKTEDSKQSENDH